MAFWNNMKKKMKGVVSKLLKRDETIKDIIQAQIPTEAYELLDRWKEIYKGDYKRFIKKMVYTVDGSQKRPRHTINMAKVLTEELSKLIFTEKVEINVGSEGMHEYIEGLLESNKFKKQFQNRVEYTLALGGYVIKAHPEQDFNGDWSVKIKYVSPDSFVPLSWDDSGNITEGVFIHTERKRNKFYNLLEYHRWEIRNKEIVNQTTGESIVIMNGDKPMKEKVLVITNELYEVDAAYQNATIANQSSLETTIQGMKRVPLDTLYTDLEEVTTIQDITLPLFRYIKPNLANNIDIDSPLGISVYANAEDTLYAINVAFDSFINEFAMGRRRIIVPEESVRVVHTKDGVAHRYFDAQDEVYVAFRGLDPEKQKIMDNTVEIRVTEHAEAIKTLLTILAMQIGVNPGFFTFDGTGLKTATEVISENSKTYHTITSMKNLLEDELISFVKTLIEVSMLYEVIPKVDIDEVEVTIQWDDSVIGDKYTDTDYQLKLQAADIVSKRYVMKQVLNLTDEQIDDMLEEIQEEKNSMMPQGDLESILMGSGGDGDNQQPTTKEEETADKGSDE